jgi:hypothetical protein
MSTPFHSSSNTTPDAPTGTSNVAIVTGASSGIGLEVTKRLAAKDYRVVANSRNITSAMTLQATGDLKLVDGDIGLPETAQRVVAVAMRDFGRIDLLVNSAGVFIPKPFTEYLSAQSVSRPSADPWVSRGCVTRSSHPLRRSSLIWLSVCSVTMREANHEFHPKN